MAPTAESEGRPIICAGNWIVDIVHTIEHWPQKSDLARIKHATQGVGGGAANVAFALKALDERLDVLPVGRIGSDEYGDFVERSCKQRGLSAEHLSRDASAPTAHTHVMNLPGDSRTFFYQGGANDIFHLEHVHLEVLRQHGGKQPLFYFGYLMLLGSFDALRGDGTTMAADLLQSAQKAGMITCVDLVSAAHDDFAAIVAAALPYMDYLIINEVEAGRVVGYEVADPASLETAGQALLSKGVQRAAIIHTAEHAVWVDRSGQVFNRESEAVSADKIVSPVGAGDAFCAGVIYGVHQSWAPDMCLDLGHKAAAASLSNMTATGGIPPAQELLTSVASTTAQAS
ncbi:MAG: carbohydrate kinase family protein [Pseudomonadota bacterium]